jgi:putative phosphoserine phosphatase/1-acylglycerol-3-phosphate O-acyltransferase
MSTREPAAKPGGAKTAMRLPGSLAEVEASPQGPEIGAYFDLDGTLVAGFTATVHTRERIRRRELGVGELLRTLQMIVDYRLGRVEFERLIDEGSMVFGGKMLDDLDEVGERVFRNKIADLMYPEMKELVRAHQNRGHTVVLSSSATSIQVEPVARYLGIENVLCNRFEADESGMLTGKVVRPIIWGSGKADAAQRFAAENGVDIAKSYFYADGDEDVALMHLVGHPRPTNPGERLEKIAKKRGWPVLKFTSRGARGPMTRARTLVGVGSLVPIGAGALAVGLATRSRRKGINVLQSLWPNVLLAVNGVKLNVVGEKNLAQRPAVFIFNHRNQVDPLVTAALIKDNYTGVAKKELENNPIMGTIGKLSDVAFVDRSDTQAAVETLKSVEEAARKGLSIIVSPEGTRLDTTEVGPFKKGPFRMAMAAKVPIVPIIIRNAESIAGLNSGTMNPGTVDVAVLPPISVEDWTVEDLPKRIEEVRQLYLDTLRDWPQTAGDRP